MNHSSAKITVPAASLLGMFSLASFRFFGTGAFPEVFGSFWPLFFVFALRCAEGKAQEIGVLITLFLGYTGRYLGFFDSGILDIMLMAVTSVLVFLMLKADRRFMRKTDCLAGTLFLPALWMSLYALNWFLKLNTQYRVDIFVFDWKLLLQAESLIGSCGVNFLLLWLASSACFAWEKRREKSGLKLLALMAAVLGLVLGYGGIRLGTAGEAAATVRTAYTTGPYIGDYTSEVCLSLEENTASFDRSVKEAAAGGARILAFNEEAFTVDQENAEEFLGNACAKAKEYGLYILLGLDLEGAEGGKRCNRAVWVSPEGTLMGKYDKYCLIPYTETDSFEKGDGKLLVLDLDIDGRTVRTATAICYDGNFSNYISRMPGDVDILFTISWDWKPIQEVHYRLTGCLSAENGVSLLKATYDGWTLGTDPYGRTVCLTNNADVGFETVQFTELPAEGCSAPYNAIGPYLCWLSLPLLAALLLWSRKKKTP